MSEQERGPESVEERHFGQAFDELAGRTPPPDRSERILARVAAGPQPQEASPLLSGSRALVAAVLLLGLGVTVLAWRMSGAGDGRGPSDPQPESPKQVVQVPDGPAPKGEARPVHDSDLPKGTDPADLAAMRSAEAMLAAERKLQQMIANGKIAGVDQVLPFEDLGNWKYTDGLTGAPDDVRALDGKQVLMLGFMLPLDEVEGMREFLLVSSLWSCCYGTPPDVHGIVRCRMAAGRKVDYQFEPIKVVGRFSVRETHEDDYCVDIYQLDVELLEVVQ